MDDANKIDIEEYRYNLLHSRIAKYPLADRDQSKLLHYEHGTIGERSFRELPEIIPEGAWLVFNNTKVIQARLQFRKATGARIEVFCLEPLDPADYQQSFQSTDACIWKCLVGNAKKWKKGPISLSTVIDGYDVVLEATVSEQNRENFTIQFRWNNSRFTFGEIVEIAGTTPIPPYLDRDAEESDKERYQTIYSRDLGSVAAPTAGLHFTDRMIQQLREDGIRTAEITLHVGAGTFVPVKETNARNHSMHAEQVVVTLAFLEQWMAHPNGLIAVGTTSSRSLESLYWLGVKLLEGDTPDPGQITLKQWDNEHLSGGFTLEESLKALIAYCREKKLDQFHFSTQLMIVPGYRFRAISGLITNFHLPGSTLLLLIAAFIGEDWKKVYEFAVKHQYRFLSYGDSSLLLPGKQQQLQH
ncbi:MAG: S-adenosylmethionine:tRNA ribosyltransferase-isomerase [Bacteroidota bacterium]